MKRAVMIILDGAADLPLSELGNQTPLEVARIPTLDRLAKEGICGAFSALGPGTLVGSDTAILGMLGYDPLKVYGSSGFLMGGSLG